MKLKTKLVLASAFLGLCVAIAIGQSYSTFSPIVGGGGTVNFKSKPFPVNPMDYGAFADSAGHTITAQDITDHSAGGSKTLWVGRIVRTVTDGSVTSGQRTITSNTANFTVADVGQRISGSGLPPESRISSVTNSTTAAINQYGTEATATYSGNATWDIGDYKAGDQWDYVALQEAIYAAFQNGTSTPNKNNRWLNRPLYIPAGRYRVNKPPTMYEVQGGNVYGDGRLSTQIFTTSTNTPAWSCNGLWFTQFTGIQWYGGSGDHTMPLFEVDGYWATDYQGHGYSQAVQGNTWKDCHWDSNFTFNPLFAMCRHGTNSQGSENLFLNCHFNNPYHTAFENYTYNALQNTFIGGNFTQHITGIHVQAGSVQIFSVGFQGKKWDQVDKFGYDLMVINSSNSHVLMSHCRSESGRMAYLGNGVFGALDGDYINMTPPNGVWTANHVYAQGQVVLGNRTADGGHGNGHIHIVWGVTGDAKSGATEPVWTDSDGSNPTAPTLEAQGCSMTSGSTTLTCTGQFANWGTRLNGRKAKVVGAGAAGANLYATVVSTTSINAIELDTAASTDVTDNRAVIGPATTDNNVIWLQEEYKELLINSPVTVRNCSFQYGQISANHATWLTTIEHCNFGRSDPFYRGSFGASASMVAPLFPLYLTIGGQIVTSNFLTLNGGTNSGDPAVKMTTPFTYALGERGGTFSVDNLNQTYTVTFNDNATINDSGVGTPGAKVTYVITALNTTPRTITFGTNFYSTGTLSTGSVTGKVFTVSFVCKDATHWIETGRTGPL